MTKRTVWEQIAMEYDCYNTVQQAFLSDQAHSLLQLYWKSQQIQEATESVVPAEGRDG